VAQIKLVMTLLVRDEQDVLEHNIEFHRRQGVDFFIIMDNLSVDRTAAIARRYVDKGLARYILQQDDDYEQGRWVTGMARMAHDEYGADWVINNDADEFWWPREGTLKESFAQLGARTNALLAQRTNFVMLEHDETQPFYRRMIFRQAVSLNPIGQPLPPKVAHRGHPLVEVAQGNHGVTGMGVLDIAEGPVEILHFPNRTTAQLVNKIAKGGAAYERNARLPVAVGGTWRSLYRDLRAHGTLDRYGVEQAYDARRVQTELADGRLLRDERLVRYLDAEPLADPA
jgi:hypothetical protein